MTLSMERHKAEWISYTAAIDLISPEFSNDPVDARLPSITNSYVFRNDERHTPIELLTPSLDVGSTILNGRDDGVQEYLPPLSNSTSRAPDYQSSSTPGNPSIATNNPGPKSQAFTFVNVRTSTGKRDWAAESQIRSHAMKRVQRQRQKAKRLMQIGPISHLQTGTASLSPSRGQGPSTCGCRDVGCPNTELTCRNLCTRETGFSPNVPLSESSDDRQTTRVDCRPRSDVFALHRADPIHVPTPAPNSLLQMPFLSLFQKPKLLMNPRMESLLCYLLSTYFQLTMPAIYGRGSWTFGSEGPWRNGLNQSLYDEPNLQVWCSIAAYHKASQMMSLPSSRTSSMRHLIHQQQEEASQHMHNAMRMINRRFQEDNGVPSFSSVMAVSSLVIATAMSGAFNAMRTHHDGLVKLVEMRGGAETFPRVEALGLSRIDSNAAWTEGRRPRLPVYINPAPQERTYPQTTGLSQSLQRFFANSPLFTVASDLQALSLTLEVKAREDGSLPSEDIIHYEDKFAAIQYGIADFPYLEHDFDTSVWYYRQNCWRNAAFIYLNTAIRTSPSRALLRSATDRLISSLKKSELGQWWGTHSDILLWVLSMALNGDFEDDERGPFELQFRQLISHMGLPSFKNLKEVLKQQMWKDSILDQALKDACSVDGRRVTSLEDSLI